MFQFIACGLLHSKPRFNSLWSCLDHILWLLFQSVCILLSIIGNATVRKSISKSAQLKLKKSAEFTVIFNSHHYHHQHVSFLNLTCHLMNFVELTELHFLLFKLKYYKINTHIKDTFKCCQFQKVNINTY